MRTETAVSAGGVVFRKTDDFEIAVAYRAKDEVWHLPKGAVEDGESLKQTAVREVKEETGLLGEVVEKIGQIDYWFYTSTASPTLWVGFLTGSQRIPVITNMFIFTCSGSRMAQLKSMILRWTK